MGYWINHHIRVEGNKENIEALASKLTQRRPKSLNDEGDIVWSEEQFSFYNILPPPEELIMSGKWWTEEGAQWRQDHWECYDAPAEEFDVFTPYSTNKHLNNARVLTIRIDTKYDWPISMFHKLIEQYPDLWFSVWSEGEESEAIEIKGANGKFTQVEYESPDSHADWVKRGDTDSCYCSSYEDPEYWYQDCPRDELTLYKVTTTSVHYVYSYDKEKAIDAIKAYENTFELPSNTKIEKYSITPEFIAEETSSNEE
jgi:hypothetical protein